MAIKSGKAGTGLGLRGVVCRTREAFCGAAVTHLYTATGGGGGSFRSRGDAFASE